MAVFAVYGSGLLSENFGLFLLLGGFLLFVGCGVAEVNFDLAHPLVWFNILFAVYSLSTPILYLIGEYNYYEDYMDYFRNSEVVFCEYLALVAFTLGAGTRRFEARDTGAYEGQENALRRVNVLLILSLLFCGAYIYVLITSGMQAKVEKIADHSAIYATDFCFYILTVAVSARMVKRKLEQGKMDFTVPVCVGLFILLALLIAGERGPVFRYFLAITMLFHMFYKPIPVRYLVVAFPCALYASTVAGIFKMLLLVGTDALDFQGVREKGNFLLAMLSGEFRTASENLAVAVQAIPSTIPFLLGESIQWDLIRTFIPNFLFERGTFPSTVDWFNQTFFPELYASGGGVGFSLVGFGYVNFGYVGILCLFAIIGFFVRQVHRKSATNVFFLIFYVNLAPLLSYGIRSDLATLLSQSLKHILLPLLLLNLISLKLRLPVKPAESAIQRVTV